MTEWPKHVAELLIAQLWKLVLPKQFVKLEPINFNFISKEEVIIQIVVLLSVGHTLVSNFFCVIACHAEWFVGVWGRLASSIWWHLTPLLSQVALMVLGNFHFWIELLFKLNLLLSQMLLRRILGTIVVWFNFIVDYHFVLPGLGCVVGRCVVIVLLRVLTVWIIVFMAVFILSQLILEYI